MTQDEVIEMAREADFYNHTPMYFDDEMLVAFANLVAKHTLMNIDPSKFMSHQEVMEAARLAEREACEALHEHEDVQAPIGNSSWGEAYQEGWAQGTAAYRAAIRARGEA